MHLERPVDGQSSSFVYKCASLFDKASSRCHESTEMPRAWNLRASELAMMLDGMDLRSIKRVRRYSRKKVPS